MNRAEQIQKALDQYDRHMIEATGYTRDQYDYIRQSGPTSLDHVKLYGCFIDESGVPELLTRYDREDRKSAAGRKPQLTYRTILILLAMHIDHGDGRYNTIASTLFAKTTPETREYLGLPILLNDLRQWYLRYRHALNRALDLCEPWQVSKLHHINAEEFAAAKDTYSQVKRDRMDEVMNAFLAASVRRLPADIAARYKGNVAIDGTPLFLVGKVLPGWETHAPRRNLNPMAGPYKRDGDHLGDGHHTNEPAWELETVVTVANKPGDPLSFPVLMTGVTMHQPGRNKYGPLIALKFHTRLFERARRHRLMADGVYNYFNAERFQVEIRRLGFRGVWNFRGKRGGKQGSIGDAICVDGRLYLKWMPVQLQTASIDFEDGLITEAVYRKHLRARVPYELLDHGKPDEDGYQRFTYPPITKDLALFDPNTNKKLKQMPKLTSTSIQVGPDSHETVHTIIKHLSAVAYESEEWAAWYGLRNRAEENNDWFKSDEATDIGNPSKRRAAGYAYNAITASMAAALSNIRRIVSHLEAEALVVVDRSDLRARRRVDIDGNPLKRLEAAAA